MYVVTSGQYSDYGINGVFDSKELAELWVNTFKDSSYDSFNIEEWDLNPHIKEIKKGCKPYFIRMDKMGNVIEVRIADSTYGFGDTLSFSFDVRLNLYMNLFAKDEKHAIKICNDKRAELIATNKWEVK